MFDDTNPVFIGATPILVGISVSFMVNKKPDPPHQVPAAAAAAAGQAFSRPVPHRGFGGACEGEGETMGKYGEHPSIMGTSINEGLPIAMFDCWRALKKITGDHLFSNQIWIIVEHVPYNFGREHPFCGSLK